MGIDEGKDLTPTARRRAGGRNGRTRLALMAAAALLAGLAALALQVDAVRSTLGRATDRVVGLVERLPLTAPNVAWPRSTPEREGLDPAALARLQERLAAHETNALLVARNGRLVLEDYTALSKGPNELVPNAALAKSVTGALAVLAAWDAGLLDPDDPVAKYVPDWRGDPLRSQVTLRHLLTHSGGVENVSFQRPQEGWKGEYRRDLDGRFRMALERAPVQFEPGSRYGYSGTGFYVLAYAVARGLVGTPLPDVRALLRERLMQPLEIPDRAWRLNYGRVAQVDGMSLYAIGSGASYTPRAVARIGQLLLDEGRYEGRTVLDPQHVQAMLQYGGSPPVRPADAEQPASGLGVWLNCDGWFPSLPRDAALGAGAGHEVLLVVPSWNLVLVRLGESLGRDHWEGDFWDALQAELLEPLAEALPEAERKEAGPAHCGPARAAAGQFG